jgi:hypothetical protein
MSSGTSAAPTVVQAPEAHEREHDRVTDARARLAAAAIERLVAPVVQHVDRVEL